jgi:hypothetical protein
MCRYCHEFISRIKKFFERQGVKFDGIYYHKSTTSYSDYSQIYEDFSIAKEDIPLKIIIVGPFSISREDYMVEKCTLSLIVKKAARCTKHCFNTYKYNVEMHFLMTKTPIIIR